MCRSALTFHEPRHMHLHFYAHFYIGRLTFKVYIQVTDGDI